MDDADTGLEIGTQSVRHPVRRQGAGVNTSYTVNLTPPRGATTLKLKNNGGYFRLSLNAFVVHLLAMLIL
jgi:hypothetical protein